MTEAIIDKLVGLLQVGNVSNNELVQTINEITFHPPLNSVASVPSFKRDDLKKFEEQQQQLRDETSSATTENSNCEPGINSALENDTNVLSNLILIC